MIISTLRVLSLGPTHLQNPLITQKITRKISLEGSQMRLSHGY